MPTESCFEMRPNHPGVPTTVRSHPSSITAERRRIAPVSGRALEILGHAIEYLTDEYGLSAAEMGAFDSGDPRIEAVQTLMALNRQIYFSCPEVEPALRRIARWLFGVPSLGSPSSH